MCDQDARGPVSVSVVSGRVEYLPGGPAPVHVRLHEARLFDRCSVFDHITALRLRTRLVQHICDVAKSIIVREADEQCQAQDQKPLLFAGARVWTK